MNLLEPLFLADNRVSRPYSGGRLLESFLGRSTPQDGSMPEDWLASTEPADPSRAPEGLGRIVAESDAPETSLAELLSLHAPALLGEEHTAVFGETLGFRCRLADAAEPSGVWCCPPPVDGTTIYERGTAGGIGFHILATRSREGRRAEILAGLRPEAKATPAALKQAARKRDFSRLAALMYPIYPSAGETYFLPAGAPFLVGGGIFALQISLAGDGNGVGPIPLEACPDEQIHPSAIAESDLAGLRATEHVLRRSDEGYVAELLGSERTTAFSLWRVEVVARMHLTLPRPFALVLCVSGGGRMFWSGGSRDLREGDRFLQPFGVPWVEYAARERLSLLIVLPPSAAE